MITVLAVGAIAVNRVDEIRTIRELSDDITLENAKGSELNLETASGITTVPYHEGAARYFAEHGITVNTDEN